MSRFKNYAEFSDINFLMLYCAFKYIYGYKPIIDHERLEKELYDFYFMPEFAELFADISLKNEEESVDLSIAFQTAQIVGLIRPLQDNSESKSIICCDEEMANGITFSAKADIVQKMSILFQRMNERENDKEAKLKRI